MTKLNCWTTVLVGILVLSNVAASADPAKEAFEKGTSISGIFAQALMVRRALKNVDPWKSISEVHSANRGIAAAEVERAVTKAVKAVRKDRRG